MPDARIELTRTVGAWSAEINTPDARWTAELHPDGRVATAYRNGQYREPAPWLRAQIRQAVARQTSTLSPSDK